MTTFFPHFFGDHKLLDSFLDKHSGYKHEWNWSNVAGLT